MLISLLSYMKITSEYICIQQLGRPFTYNLITRYMVSRKQETPIQPT
jgi:hypothetical protein